MRSLAILGSGMVTGVGLSAPASCAAIRCAIDNFNETRFIDDGGVWIIGSEVPLEEPWRGFEKLVRMATSAIRECHAHAGAAPLASVPILLCVAEPARPGRAYGLDKELLKEIEKSLGSKLHPRSAVIARGRVSIAEALHLASQFITPASPFAMVAGVDSFLSWPTLSVYQSKSRLLTSKNSNGFIPGEAAAAVLVGAPKSGTGNLICVGIGAGHEPATVESEEPLRANGMVDAFRQAFADAGCTMADVDYRLTDLNGEQYAFKEAALAMNRTLRTRKARFPIWHPTDCVGEVGAAIGPLSLGVALAAARKGYAPGPGVLCHFADDGSDRIALVLRHQGRAA
ncbi:MAG TPA: hypothetical protein VFW23_08830 [Tepidisphaeraceae bacterium]|nr:hypothetical protein [Tepidisphaeraceae bacterium]